MLAWCCACSAACGRESESEEQTLGEAGVLMTGGLGVARLNGVSLKWLGVEIKYPAQRKRQSELQ